MTTGIATVKLPATRPVARHLTCGATISRMTAVCRVQGYPGRTHRPAMSERARRWASTSTISQTASTLRTTRLGAASASALRAAASLHRCRIVPAIGLRSCAAGSPSALHARASSMRSAGRPGDWRLAAKERRDPSDAGTRVPFVAWGASVLDGTTPSRSLRRRCVLRKSLVLCLALGRPGSSHTLAWPRARVMVPFEESKIHAERLPHWRYIGERIADAERPTDSSRSG